MKQSDFNQVIAVYVERYAMPTARSVCEALAIKHPKLDALFAKLPFVLIDSDANVHLGERNRIKPLGVGNAVLRVMDEKPPYYFEGAWTTFLDDAVTPANGITWVKDHVLPLLLELADEELDGTPNQALADELARQEKAWLDSLPSAEHVALAKKILNEPLDF